MTIVTRRKLLAGASACSLSSFVACGRWVDADVSESAPSIANEVGLPYGCIFARMDGERSPADDVFTTRSVDFWTFRVSEIETNTLPESVGRVIIWDDVFSPRTLAKRVKSILDGFPEWYGFDPRLATFSFHLDGLNEIGAVARAVLPEAIGPVCSHRLALIDVQSCGVSRIDWLNILPFLRNSYDLIVGLTHFAGRGPTDPHVLCDGAWGHSRTSSTLACCDFSFWTSDSLLGFDQVLDWETRAPLLAAVVHDLVHALSTTDLTRTLAETTEAQRLFASRFRLERPQTICL